MKKILFLILSTIWISGFSQALKPVELVQARKKAGEVFRKASFLEIAYGDQSLEEKVEIPRGEYTLYSLDEGALQQFRNQPPDIFSLSIPSREGTTLEVELVKVNIFTPDFSLLEGGSNADIEAVPGSFYRGIIKGQPGSIAAVSIFPDEVRGLFSSVAEGNLVLGKLKGSQPKGKHILYQDRTVRQELSMDCYTPDDGKGYTEEEVFGQAMPEQLIGDCVRLYFEIDHDIYEDFDEQTADVFNYVTGLFNEVGAIYANERISTMLSGVMIWATDSPYSGTTAINMLSLFKLFRTQFNGDLGQLLSNKVTEAGMAVGINGLCNSNPAQRLSFSGVNNDFEVVPTYSWDVDVVAHEFGHSLGSRHTHACVWNGNNTAIDGCSGYTEWGCSLPGIPSNGGTIMSYCDQVDEGKNFALGFGEQPGNVIRYKVTMASCLSRCESISCPRSLVISEASVFPDGLVQAETTIKAYNVVDVGWDLAFQAGHQIDLMPGFHAKVASYFDARIQGCTSGAGQQPGNFSEVAVERPSLERQEPETETEKLSLKVYPNPLHSIATLDYYLPHDGPVDIVIFDFNGRVVQNLARKDAQFAGHHLIEMDASFLAPGMYICHLITENEVKAIRFSVAR